MLKNSGELAKYKKLVEEELKVDERGKPAPAAASVSPAASSSASSSSTSSLDTYLANVSIKTSSSSRKRPRPVTPVDSASASSPVGASESNGNGDDQLPQVLKRTKRRTAGVNFDEEDDRIILEAVKDTQRFRKSSDPSTIDWNKINKIVFENRFQDGYKIAGRYYSSLHPNLKKGPWTQEEDDELIRLAKEHGTHWTQLSKLMNFTRYSATIRKRYKYLKDQGEIADSTDSGSDDGSESDSSESDTYASSDELDWTEELDKNLRTWVSMFERRNKWQKLSELFQGKFSPREVERRFYRLQYLDKRKERPQYRAAAPSVVAAAATSQRGQESSIRTEAGEPWPKRARLDAEQASSAGTPATQMEEVVNTHVAATPQRYDDCIRFKVTMYQERIGDEDQKLNTYILPISRQCGQLSVLKHEIFKRNEEFLKQKGFNDGESLIISYEDADGDWISMDRDTEFKACTFEATHLFPLRPQQSMRVRARIPAITNETT